MSAHPSPGEPATPAILTNVPRLITAYYTEVPDPSDARQRVAFGTSGHRGSSLDRTFNEWHVLATTQAICEYRRHQKIDGPLFVGIDTHALSVPAGASALEVLAANGVEVMLAEHDEYTPTPVVSHAILTYNRGRTTGLADGIVITPSHNPPESGGFKYNPPNGGPADTDVTGWIETRANELLLQSGLDGLKRMPFDRALHAATTHRHDYLNAYVNDLANVIDLDAIRGATLRLGVDPLGGAGARYWPRDRRALRSESDRGQRRDRSHVSVHDGRLGRPYSHGPVLAVCHAKAARPAEELRRGLRVRPRPRSPRDRHAPAQGLLPPNHYLAVAIDFLFRHRPRWRPDAARRQDHGQQPDDRSRHRQARADALRDAGRLQVVRGGHARRLAGLRRRRERGRLVSAARRCGVVDRQGRDHSGAALGGDHGTGGPRPRRDLSRR